MKKQLFRYLSGVVPAVALFTNLNAQPVQTSPESNAAEYVINDAKISPSITDEGNTVNVNPRALNDFRKNFNPTANADWMQLKHGFVAKFKTDGVETRVFYDPQGRWSSTILTYNEDKLPKDIRKEVRRNYYDYSIFLVHEVKVGDQKVYLVSIQDKQYIKTIRVSEEQEMDIYEDMEKSE